MLALCRTKGWAERRLPARRRIPVQHGCLHEVASAADADPEEIPTAIDGCGVLTVRLPLERMALMFSRLEQSREARSGRRDARPPETDPRPDGRPTAS
jgi:L-asparaginase II